MAVGIITEQPALRIRAAGPADAESVIEPVSLPGFRHVFSDNEAAVAGYRKFGFEVEGTLHGHSYRDGRCIDSLSMARLRGL
ncbi:hypothetical protein J8I26_17740 [Herbaspirillum sp. LeCh32-8]|uniref:hypothetical protein n=1 Tax=Herbaspirillum sp. LeCh32-8 TaxID=2821356 RepID=UPI001AEB7D0F|nr:hypothetical protein [Herbaspirillum sp. LeCh32-8]MBP0599957.1 hypothetical protein [Herbaspirillum sp. LeCh32-8]